MSNDKNLEKRKGTIAWWLNQNMSKIMAAGDSIRQMKTTVLALLDADEIKDNPAVPKAKDVLSKANGSAFLSTLTTYLTGLKV